MAAAGQHGEIAVAHGQRVAVLDAVIGRRNAGRAFQVFMAAAQHDLGRLGGQSVPLVERPENLLAVIGRGALQDQAVQILRARHCEIKVVGFAQPPGEPDMVGVEMRHDQRLQALAL